MRLHINRSIVRLAASYLGVMLLVSITFSVLFYVTSASALHAGTFAYRTPMATQSGSPLPSLPPEATSLEHQTALIRHSLLVRLTFLNVGVFIVGLALSYCLARRTIQPMETAMALQEQFFSNASHELKTPLSALRLRGEVTLRNPALTLTEAKTTIASNVEQSIKLERLSRDLLELTKAGYTTTELRPISLAMVTSNAIKQVADAAQSKSIRIVHNVHDISVCSDTDRLTQVVVILLDNAIKYSPQNTSIYIDATCIKREVIVKVRDEGPGIVSNDLPHIFERFYQGDPSRQREGFGLGLPIAAAIIKHLRGSIHVTSSSQGSVFSINVPVSRNKNNF